VSSIRVTIGSTTDAEGRMLAKPILEYEVQRPKYVEYDPAVIYVAGRVSALIEAAAPWVKVEHIGSTAVPGCAGKGIVDLVALYRVGRLAATRKAIDALGFQPQRVGHTFPEDRPMRVGAIEHDGRVYRLHVHIVAEDREEVVQLRHFRDALREDSALRDDYEAKKRAILQAGQSEPVGYTQAKGEFISAVLANHR
jgi:GrpB-like predicted nucleotidyltransferase (UPF0157 family)